MKLLTDYPQWYDTLFDGVGDEFQRVAFAPGGLSKRRQFALFERLGLQTPPHGIVADLAGARHQPPGSVLDARHWIREVQAVVYLDELAHAGTGKVKLPLAEALAEHAGAYASLFIPHPAGAVTFRQVRFGRREFWLRQQGAEDWRSNHRDRETILAASLTSLPNPLPRVLWAIDYLPSATGLLAIDFNTAPDLATLGSEAAATVDELHEELERAAREQPASLRQF